LKILKRSTTPSEPAAASTNSSPGPDAARNRERERKEKERRYQEAREKIFNGGNAQSSSPTKKGGKGGNGKRSGKSTPTPPPKSTPEKKKSPQRQPTAPDIEKPVRKPSPPIAGGAVLGFSLNNGTFSAPVAPAPPKDDWRLKQVAIDGKMLESQAAAYGFTDDNVHGEEDGLDWDEFRRDFGGGETVERMQRLDINDAMVEGEFEKQRERGGAEKKETEIRASRAPRGPDANGGRGFGARRGGRGRE
jgi:hypothetical protein